MNHRTRSVAASTLDRRALLGALAGGTAGLACGGPRDAVAPGMAPAVHAGPGRAPATMVGSHNALRGMRQHYARLQAGADPLDVAIDVVKIVEADPGDRSVGLGGLPDEDGVVTLDAACMHGPTHNAGSVGCLRNILHPSEVARLVMERTDHVMLVGEGAYRFARDHGHPHVELLTEETRQIWVDWKEALSERDDRLAPPGSKDERTGRVVDWNGEQVAVEDLFDRRRPTGTIHVSALGADGALGCTTTTSGLAWKIPGRVGDSPLVGAGLYLDQDAGSAGGTGRGESAILSHASSACVELMRGGTAPLDAGLEVLRRVARQAQRAASWQPALVDDEGRPAFDLRLYVLGLDGRTAGVSLRGRGRYSLADPEGGPRTADLVGVFD